MRTSRVNKTSVYCHILMLHGLDSIAQNTAAYIRNNAASDVRHRLHVLNTLQKLVYHVRLLAMATVNSFAGVAKHQGPLTLLI